MRSKVERHSEEAEKAIRDIRRATRRHFSAEEKVRIVIAGLRGEDSVAELCRKEGINQNLYYRWSKDFPEAGKKRLAGDTVREATSDEVKGLRAEGHQLKELLAELVLENRPLKKSALGNGEAEGRLAWGGNVPRIVVRSIRVPRMNAYVGHSSDINDSARQRLASEVELPSESGGRAAPPQRYNEVEALGAGG